MSAENPSKFVGTPVAIDLGLSDSKLVAAKTAILYGDSGLGKSTNLMYAAKWLYERTGKPVRLVAAEDSSKTVFEPLIKIGVVEAVFLTKSANPVSTLRRLSRGEWPQFRGDKVESWSAWNGGYSGYIVEGLSSISEQILEDCRAKGRFLGEQKTNAVQEGSETIALPGKFSYNLAQLETLRLLTSFGMIDGIERVFWSAHETKGFEEGSNLQIRGPALVGLAKTGAVQKYCGLLLHIDGYPATKKLGEISVIETKVRIWFRRHPDNTLPNVSYPAKVTIPVEHIETLHKRFPHGYFEPTIKDGELQPNLADFLEVEQQIISTSTDRLAQWKAKVDEKLKKGV